MAGAKGGRGGQGQIAAYPKIPIVFSVGGSKYASAEEKAQRRATITRFISEAADGNVYRTGSGVGSAGAEFEIVQRRGKLAIQWVNSNHRAVDMSRANVESFIKNGAVLIRRKRK